MNKKIKLVLILLVVIISILIIVGLIGAYKDKISNYFEERRAQAVYNEMLAELNTLEEKKRNDFVGGKTPEETIEMYLEALKKGDINLANSYYVVGTVEKDELSEVPTIIKNVEKLITTGQKKCGVDLYKIDYCDWAIENEKGLIMKIDIEKNPYTNIWKIVY